MNDMWALFILCTDENYFHDKMIRDEHGSRYFMPPRDTELTFRLIDNEIVPFVGRESNISPWLVVELMKLFSREFMRRFNLLHMSESDIIKFLGRSLSTEEILAKKTTEDVYNSIINSGEIPSSDLMSYFRFE